VGRSSRAAGSRGAGNGPLPTLHLDLDGTLVDVRRRHYKAYFDTAEELGLRALPEHDYWGMRRTGASLTEVIGDASPQVRERFAKLWLERIESPSYVLLDTLIPGARATLAALRESYELVLVALRSNPRALLDQLDDMSLRKFFSAVYARDAHDPEARARLVQLYEGQVAVDNAVSGAGAGNNTSIEAVELDDVIDDLDELRRLASDSRG